MSNCRSCRGTLFRLKVTIIAHASHHVVRADNIKTACSTFLTEEKFAHLSVDDREWSSRTHVFIQKVSLWLLQTTHVSTDLVLRFCSNKQRTRYFQNFPSMYLRYFTAWCKQITQLQTLQSQKHSNKTFALLLFKQDIEQNISNCGHSGVNKSKELDTLPLRSASGINSQLYISVAVVAEISLRSTR